MNRRTRERDDEAPGGTRERKGEAARGTRERGGDAAGGSEAPRVVEQLARLREVGALLRQRRTADVVAVCGAVLERFRDPGSEERRALEAALPEATGFAPATLRAGLDLALADWTAEALEAVVARELGPDPDAAAEFLTGLTVTATRREDAGAPLEHSRAQVSAIAEPYLREAAGRA